MRKPLVILLFSVLIGNAFNCPGQAIERRFINFSLENGLSQSTIFDIKQDALGYTWIATAEGVNVFDGSKFEVYKNSPKDTNTLSDNFVYAILPFNDGTVWAITQGRMINEIDIKSKKVKHIAPINELKQGMYSAKQLIEGPKGNVWLSTYENGIFILNRAGKVIKHIKASTGLIKNNKIQNVHIGKNYIWISTASGLSRINKDLSNAKQYFENRVVGASHTFRNNVIISFFDDARVIKSSISNPENIQDTIISNESILSIVSQKDGTLWLGTINNGIIEVSDNSTFRYTQTQSDRWSLIDNNIFALYTDPNDNIWIGTNSGLSVYKKAYNQFKLYRHNDNWNSLSSNKVYDILEDKVGNIWFVNYDGAVDKLENNVFTKFETKDKVSNQTLRVRCLHQAKNDKYYIGTNERGLYNFNPSTGSFTALGGSDFIPQNIKKIIDYDSGNLLIAHGDGISIYHAKSNTYTSPIIDDGFVSYDLVKEGNTLWVATFGNGLYKVNIKDWSFKNYKHINNQPSISSDNIIAIVQISSDTLALGTYGGGVCLFNKKTEQFLNFSESDGLGNNNVYGILKDQKNNLWLSTNKGLSKWNANRKTVKNFDLPAQVQSLEFNEDAFLKSSDGTFYFGGVNGVNFFNPNQIIPNTNTPLAIISEFLANDKIKDISKAIANLSPIQLKTSENYIQIFFNAMRFTVPEKTQFFYRLEGLETEWRTSVNEAYVRYNNLSPGSYTFQLKACNEDGYCDDKIQELKFAIAAPIYKTFWFLALLSLLFLAGIFYIYRFRTNNLRREYAAKMTNAELRALRIQMNPHFIFNSLNSIQYYVLNSDSKTAYKYLTKFSSLMRRTLQNSKENFLPLKDELESLEIYLDLENMRLEDSLEIEINTDEGIDQDRTLVPTLFMQPFVENAIIHGLLPKSGNRKITIGIEKIETGIRCIIEDNGIGRTASRELNKKRNRSHQSTAINAIENRIKILNASANTKIKLEMQDLYDNNKACGTKVILDIA